MKEMLLGSSFLLIAALADLKMQVGDVKKGNSSSQVKSKWACL